MNKVDSVTILAGGGGKRLWPASTEKRPKQFMKVGTDKSLLLQTLERSWALEPSIGVFVVCNQLYTAELVQQVNILPVEQAGQTYVLPEPCMRNTATALFYVNLWIEQLAGPQAINLVQTSDHLVSELDIFKQKITEAAALARGQKIVVFGIAPTYAASGYGYIERGQPLAIGGFEVLRFTEKPNEETAKEFIASQRFYWNSGMFCYPVGLFRQELWAHSPNITAALASAFQQPALAQLIAPSAELAAAYNACDNISIDYALMEKTSKLALLPAAFGWKDIGSWDVFSSLEPSSAPILVEVGSSSGNFVRSSMPVALCNVSNLIVVEENGTLLICQKGSSELVKEARSITLKKSDKKL